MGDADVLPIICETTGNANVADVIHCLTTEVLSEGTWESLIFHLNTIRDYKRRLPRDTWVADHVKQRAALCLLHNLKA